MEILLTKMWNKAKGNEPGKCREKLPTKAGWMGLANKNTGCLVTFEFQKTTSNFSSIIMPRAIFGICLC